MPKFRHRSTSLLIFRDISSVPRRSAGILADLEVNGSRRVRLGAIFVFEYRVISLAGWLCGVVESDGIMLPCREVAKTLGVRPNTVACYRQQAIEHGYLTQIKAHTYRPGGKGETTEFRFRVDWWDYLTKRMPKA